MRTVRYLLGDSTDVGLEFNYLAFLRELVDVAVALVQHDLSRTDAEMRRQAIEQNSAGTVKAIEDLGRRTLADVTPVIQQLAAALAASLEPVVRDETRLRAAALDKLDKLVRSYDLPAAKKVYEVAIGA